MRKIGLVGGLGPESTADFYRCLQFEVRKLTGRDVMAPVAIDSIDAFRVLEYADSRRYKELSQYLMGSIADLAGADVRFATIIGITPHVVFPEIENRVPVSVASMVDTVIAHCVNNGYKKVGLFGTTSTLRENFLTWGFAAQKIEVVIPDDSDARFINDLIMNRLEYKPISAEDRERASAIIDKMVEEKGIDALLMGCSELPAILSGIDLEVPAIDVIQVHAKTMATLVVEESDKAENLPDAAED